MNRQLLNFRVYMKRIQEIISETKVADGLRENSWLEEVLTKFDQISREFALELQNEPGAPQYVKPDGTRSYQEMPPTRVLSLVVPLSAWLGWVSHQKNGDVYVLQKIKTAFEYGRNLSIRGEDP